MSATDTSELDVAEARVWRSLGVAPRHHDLRLPDLRTTVRVTEVGDPTGPPVLFVHGGSVAGPSWAELVARLPAFRCLLLDRPGCGHSSAVAGDGIEGLLDLAERLVVDVMDGLGLERSSVVGTSYGGPFALRAAASHPGRVERLVLVGWCLGMPGPKAPLSLRIGMLPGLRSLGGLVPPSPRLLRIMLGSFGMRRAVKAGRFSDEAMDWLVALYRGTDTLRSELETAGPVVSLRGGWDARLMWSDELLAAVTAPTLVLFGDEDPHGTIEGARALARRMHDARVHVLARAGHAPWLDRPDTFVAAMADHLTITEDV